jgi:oxygen-independent coproporphyrinogen-3 oxidase
MHDLAQYIENCAKLEKEQNQKSNLSQGEKPLQKPSIKNHPIQIRRDYIELTKNQQMEEFMFLGLRMCHLGISKQKFQEQFQLDIHEVYGNVLHKLISNYLLEEEGDRIRLTDYGIDISNGVLAEFLLD